MALDKMERTHVRCYEVHAGQRFAFAAMYEGNDFPGNGGFPNSAAQF